MSDDYQYATEGDLSAIITLIEAHCDPANVGYPAFVEPEPATTKGRFGRVKEEAVEFSVGLHLADASTGSMEIIMVPDASAVASAFERGDIPLASGWRVDASMPGSGRIVSEGRSDAAKAAEWFVDTLTAIGAPLPTGRWRCYSPQVPEWWH